MSYRMLLRLRQLTAHVLMLQFVVRDLLEQEDIEKIRDVCDKHKDGQTVVAVRRQLAKLAADQKQKSAALNAKKAAARTAGKEFRNDDDDNELLEEDLDDATEEEPEPVAGNPSLGGAGGQFGKEYNFKPFLNSLKTGESWERAKKKSKCGYCGKQAIGAYMSSCHHLICTPCYDTETIDVAVKNADKVDANPNPPCKTCGVTPQYFHPCDPNDEAHDGVMSRSKAEKKKAAAEKNINKEDIAEDWLAACGDEVLPSAKTIAVKSQIMNWLKENPRVKIIVYTQFLAMIKILGRICQKEGWKAEQVSKIHPVRQIQKLWSIERIDAHNGPRRPPGSIFGLCNQPNVR